MVLMKGDFMKVIIAEDEYISLMGLKAKSGRTRT